MNRSKRFKKCTAIIIGFVLFLGLFIQSLPAKAELVSSEKFLGNIIANNVPSNFKNYWNQVTPENATKWGSVESSRNNMNWGAADTCYNYANKNGYPFKFHTLVWGSQEPGWISSLSASNKKAEVLEWYKAASARYGYSEYVDVVNEPLHAKPSFKDAIGGDGSTGWDWVIWSFEQARIYFPNSKLLINEYGIINDPNATRNYLTIINLLKARGLVDGIGIQCHEFNLNTVTTRTMKNNLDSLAATGLPIYVSELDISGNDSTQLALYKEKFPVLWEHPAVKGITLWGYIEGQTWKANTHLVTSSGAERPALKWLLKYLKDNTPTPTPTLPTTPTPTPRPTIPPTPTPSQSKFKLEREVIYWNTGYAMIITITNTSKEAVNTWKMTAKNEDINITNSWCVQVTESGGSIVFEPMSFNTKIEPNASITFGFQGSGAPPGLYPYTIE